MHPLREYVGCRARLAAHAHDALFGLFEFGSARVAKSARCPVNRPLSSRSLGNRLNTCRRNCVVREGRQLRVA